MVEKPYTQIFREKDKGILRESGKNYHTFVFLFLQKDNFLPFPSLLNIIGSLLKTDLLSKEFGV